MNLDNLARLRRHIAGMSEPITAWDPAQCIAGMIVNHILTKDEHAEWDGNDIRKLDPHWEDIKQFLQCSDQMAFHMYYMMDGGGNDLEPEDWRDVPLEVQKAALIKMIDYAANGIFKFECPVIETA